MPTGTTQTSIALATQGARAIASDSLGLYRGSHLLVLLDETTSEVHDPFFLASQELDIHLTTLYYSRAQQRIMSSLGAPAESAFGEADAVILAHTADDDCSRFRTKLVSEWRNATRLGTMPGASNLVLEVAASTDVSQIVSRCRSLTLPLFHGRDCLIRTTDRNGKHYNLRLDLGGIDRLPVQSTGVIPPNAWGNVPSGEIFTAPLEDSAEGEFLVNGSIGTKVMESDEAVLTFREGRLVEHRNLSSGRPVDYLLEVERISRERSDLFWNVIAEFGVGVNSAVKEVIGLPLLDEKIYGTVHIAIGNNIGWQGVNRAQLHLDITTAAPTVEIDGREIISAGEHGFKGTGFDALEAFQSPQRYRWPDDVGIVPGRSQHQYTDNDSQLLVLLEETHSGRVTEIPIVDKSVLLPASQVLRELKRRHVLSYADLPDVCALDPLRRTNLLSLLWIYGLIQPSDRR